MNGNTFFPVFVAESMGSELSHATGKLPWKKWRELTTEYGKRLELRTIFRMRKLLLLQIYYIDHTILLFWSGKIRAIPKLYRLSFSSGNKSKTFCFMVIWSVYIYHLSKRCGFSSLKFWQIRVKKKCDKCLLKKKLFEYCNQQLALFRVNKIKQSIIYNFPLQHFPILSIFDQLIIVKWKCVWTTEDVLD